MTSATQPPRSSSLEPSTDSAIQVRVWRGEEAERQALAASESRPLPASLTSHPGWLRVLRRSLGHEPFWIAATRGERVVGCLPLAFVSSHLFGRFLVSLPYLNSGGVQELEPGVAGPLLDRAVELAAELRVRYLELRHERACHHPALTEQLTSKVHMRLSLPPTSAELWDQFKSKLRSQIRSAEKHQLTVQWGTQELLEDFYRVFARNMRDLGTPVYSRQLFVQILHEFDQQTELCVVRREGAPVAVALMLYGHEVAEVPSASSLREHNSTNANMWMYWHLLQRAVERRMRVFDFGRSSEDSNTFRFKKQWGAGPEPAIWQYHVREGGIQDMRPDNARYRRKIATWQKLPVWLANLLGPRIVRGIP